MKVKILKHAFILQAIVAIFGVFDFFWRFLLKQVEFLTEHSFLKMAKIFHQKNH
jgi:hypothetical protein